MNQEVDNKVDKNTHFKHSSLKQEFINGQAEVKKI